MGTDRPSDVDADVYLDMPYATKTAWTDASADWPFTGIPVRPQPPTGALTVDTSALTGGGAGPAVVTKAIGTDAYLLGPRVDADTTALTVVFDDLTVLEDAAGGNRELFEWQSATLKAEVDTRPTKFGARFAMEANGATVFSSAGTRLGRH